MQDKTVLITGTASGMGRIAAKALADKGARLILVDFDTEEGINSKDEIINASGNKDIEYFDCDVSSFRELRELSRQIHNHYSQLDVLINNAGITESIRRQSEDGFEMTMATNFLGPFLLTHLLLDLLMKPDNSRIINISSDGHRMAKEFDFDDINFETGWEKVNHSMGFQAYARSKLCLNLFSFILSEKLEQTNIDVFAVSPGYFINTNIHRHMRGMHGVIVNLIKPFLQSAEKGALNHIVMTSDLQYIGKSGFYWEHGKRKEASPLSYDNNLKESVWDYASKVTNIKDIGVI